MFDFNPVPLPKHNRKIVKRSKRTEFDDKTRKAISDRDDWLCVRCRTVANHIHHVTFRSTLGEGINHKRNGVCICNRCHSWAHAGREGREWFEHYRDKHLDDNGDMIRLPFDEGGDFF